MLRQIRFCANTLQRITLLKRQNICVNPATHQIALCLFSCFRVLFFLTNPCMNYEGQPKKNFVNEARWRAKRKKDKMFNFLNIAGWRANELVNVAVASSIFFFFFQNRGVILSKIPMSFCSLFSPSFFSQFGEMKWKQLHLTHFLPIPSLNQTPFPLIFSHISHFFFSIFPKINPTKHRINV